MLVIKPILISSQDYFEKETEVVLFGNEAQINWYKFLIKVWDGKIDTLDKIKELLKKIDVPKKMVQIER